eukprot:41430-Chlamydomonas_euryale.AAC.1
MYDGGERAVLLAFTPAPAQPRGTIGRRGSVLQIARSRGAACCCKATIAASTPAASTPMQQTL